MRNPTQAPDLPELTDPPRQTEPQGTQRQPPRLAILDGLRICAALLVVLFHYAGMHPTVWGAPPEQVFPTLHPFAAYGWTGVPLFFLISGFVICMSSWGRSLGSFFTSRAVRLYPAFWFAVIATATVVALTPTLPGHVERRTPSEVLLNLTMVHETFGVGHVDPPYWTLWIELRFYLLFALVVWRGVTYRRVVAFCGLWTVGALAAAGTKEPLLTYVFMPQFAPYFIAGIAFYLTYRFGPSLLLWGIVGVSWAQGLHHIHAHFTQPPWKTAAAYITSYFLLLAAISLGYFRASRRGENSPKSHQREKKHRLRRALVFAGSLSYPLYLIHQSIGLIIIERLRHILSPVNTLLVVIGVMLVLAWLIHRLVERPLAPLLSRHLGSSFTQVRATGSVPKPRLPTEVIER